MKPSGRSDPSNLKTRPRFDFCVGAECDDALPIQLFASDHRYVLVSAVRSGNASHTGESIRDAMGLNAPSAAAPYSADLLAASAAAIRASFTSIAAITPTTNCKQRRHAGWVCSKLVAIRPRANPSRTTGSPYRFVPQDAHSAAQRDPAGGECCRCAAPHA